MIQERGWMVTEEREGVIEDLGKDAGDDQKRRKGVVDEERAKVLRCLFRPRQMVRRATVSGCSMLVWENQNEDKCSIVDA